MGAGSVGTELATAYRQLGSEVMLLTGIDRILPRFESEASRRVLVSPEEMGFKVFPRTQVKKAKRERGKAIASPSNCVYI